MPGGLEQESPHYKRWPRPCRRFRGVVDTWPAFKRHRPLPAFWRHCPRPCQASSRHVCHMWWHIGIASILAALLEVWPGHTTHATCGDAARMFVALHDVACMFHGWWHCLHFSGTAQGHCMHFALGGWCCSHSQLHCTAQPCHARVAVACGGIACLSAALPEVAPACMSHVVALPACLWHCPRPLPVTV